MSTFAAAPHSPYLYCGSICVTEFGRKGTHFATLIFQMLGDFSTAVFLCLQVTQRSVELTQAHCCFIVIGRWSTEFREGWSGCAISFLKAHVPPLLTNARYTHPNVGVHACDATLPLLHLDKDTFTVSETDSCWSCALGRKGVHVPRWQIFGESLRSSGKTCIPSVLTST